MRYRWSTFAQCPFRMPLLTWTAQTVQLRQASWWVSPHQNSTARISSHVTCVLVIAQSETKCVCVPGEVFMMSEGLAECEWITAIYQDYEPSLHQGKSTLLPAEPTVTVMSRLTRPRCVCVIDAKSAFDLLVRESTGGHCRRTAQELCVIRRSMQTLKARCRWVPHERMGCRRLDEEAWEQYYDAATIAGWGPVNRGRRSRAGDEKSVP